MRLLNVYTLEFSEDFPIAIAKYVIASHRWIRNAEATLEEVRDKRDTEKIGHKKIKRFAEYVKVYVPHVEWIWIDTCCINKTSDAEVSEAINSMYKWYHNAEVCLAYLADVKTSSDLKGFMQSEWFRRGWTLQELLAPRTVVFLTEGWEVIGHKGGTGRGKSGIELHSGPLLNPSVTAVTGVPESVLNDFGQSRDYTVEEKLEWAVGRLTTREEDMSYCLLGMFDLTMAVRYREGGKKARERLVAKIKKASRGYKYQPLSTRSDPKTQSGKYRIAFSLKGIPATDYYVERADEMQQLELFFQPTLPRKGRSIFVVHGMGGMGKTQLCVRFARKYQEHFSAIFWLDGSSRDALVQSMANAASRVSQLKSALLTAAASTGKGMQELAEALLQ